MGHLKNIGILALIFIFTITISQFSLASENFEARASSRIDVCACSSEPVPIIIKNTGYARLTTIELNGDRPHEYSLVGIESTYHFSVSGSAAQFFEFRYPVVTLVTGEEFTYYGYINAPCNAIGEYDLIIDITTGSGLKKRLVQQISITNCPNIRLSTASNIRHINPCGETMFSFNIRNTGPYRERYTIDVDRLRQDITFSYNPLWIDPGQEREVLMHVDPGCDVLRDTAFNVRVLAQQSGFNAALPYEIKINDSYFDYDVIASNATYQFCSGSHADIPILINNHADSENTVGIRLSAPGFASIDDAGLVLPPIGSGFLNLSLDLAGARPGRYDVVLDAESSVQSIRKQLNLDIEVIACHGLSYRKGDIRIDYDDGMIRVEMEHFASVPASYYFSYQAPEWVVLSEGTDGIYVASEEDNTEDDKVYAVLNMSANEKRMLFFNLTHDEHVPEGSYQLDLFFELADGSGIFYGESIKIKLSEKRGFFWWVSETWGKILLIIIIDVILLLLLLLLFLLFRYSRDRKKKSKGQKTLKDIEKAALIDERKKEKKAGMVAAAEISPDIDRPKFSKGKKADESTPEDKEDKRFIRYVKDNKAGMLKILLIILILALMLFGLIWAYNAFFGPVGEDNDVDEDGVYEDSDVPIIPDTDINDSMIGGNQTINDSEIEDVTDTPVTDDDEVEPRPGFIERLKGFGDSVWLFFFPALEFMFIYKWFIISGLVLLLAILLIIWLLRQRGFFTRRPEDERLAAMQEKAAFGAEKKRLKDELRLERMRLKQQMKLEKEKVKEERRKLKQAIADEKLKQKTEREEQVYAEKESNISAELLDIKEKDKKISPSDERKRKRDYGWLWFLLILLLLVGALAALYYYGEDGFEKFFRETDNVSEEDGRIIGIDEIGNISRDYGIPDESIDERELPEDIDAVDDRIDDNITPIIIDIPDDDMTEVIIIDGIYPEGPTQEEIDALEGPVLRMQKDRPYILDLNEIFHDPDGDKLSFSVSRIENITAQIDQEIGLLSLTPLENWTGITWVWITADDGRGGITTTERIYIAVLPYVEDASAGIDPVRGVFEEILFFIKTYIYYIIIGFIILVIIILITRYNKHLVEFFDDEDPDSYIERMGKETGSESKVSKSNKQEKKTSASKESKKGSESKKTSSKQKQTKKTDSGK